MRAMLSALFTCAPPLLAVMTWPGCSLLSVLLAEGLTCQLRAVPPNFRLLLKERQAGMYRCAPSPCKLCFVSADEACLALHAIILRAAMIPVLPACQQAGCRAV